MKNGIFLIDKNGRESSAAAIARLKRRLTLERIGHAGTLDPFATGLLVCLTGRATKLADFAQKGRKLYSGSIRLGVESSTDDSTGEILRCSPVTCSPQQIAAAAAALTGVLQQIPPQVSAVKVDGERAYRRVRKGEAVSLAPRRVEVTRFEVSILSDDELQFVVECSSGTYIRSLARDLGQSLGCGAVVDSLRREFSAPFSVTDAKPVDEMEHSDMLPWEVLFPDTDRVALSAAAAAKLLHGNLHALRDELPEVRHEEKKRIVCCDAKSRTALGLLEWNSEGWSIAVNLA